MSFELMTDTASDLTFDFLDSNQISYLGFVINMNNREYYTEVKGEIDPDWFIESIQAGAEPSTSQINVGKFTEKFTEVAKNNTSLLYLAFSSGLSGTYNSALQAKEIVLEDYPNADIRILDTKMAAGGEGLIVYKALQMKNEGCSIDEVEKKIQDVFPKIRAWFTVDDLKHLLRGGRINAASALVGTLVSIKPILDVDPEGKLRSVSKVRGRKKALKTLAENIINNLPYPEEQAIFINYSGDIEAAHAVKEQIEAKVKVKEFVIAPLGPTIATHTGYGCIAVFAEGADVRE